MKVFYFPNGGFDVGSSRCRIHFLREWLERQKVDIEIYGEYGAGNPYNADIIVFQFRKFNPNIVLKAKRKNIPIIYDLNDVSKQQFNNKIKVDYMTFPTIEVLDFINQEDGKFENFMVIKDCIDYIKSPLPPRIHLNENNLNITYASNVTNLSHIKYCLNSLKKIYNKNPYNFYYISGTNEVSYKSISAALIVEKMKYINAKWIRWNFNTFVKNFIKTDFSLSPQTRIDKPATKVKDFIALNVPIIFSNIPSHYRFACATDTKEFCCNLKNSDEWYKAISKMCNPKVRNKFLKKTLPYVWKNYSIEYIGGQWLSLFEELTNKK